MKKIGLLNFIVFAISLTFAFCSSCYSQNQFIDENFRKLLFDPTFKDIDTNSQFLIVFFIQPKNCVSCLSRMMDELHCIKKIKVKYSFDVLGYLVYNREKEKKFFSTQYDLQINFRKYDFSLSSKIGIDDYTIIVIYDNLSKQIYKIYNLMDIAKVTPCEDVKLLLDSK